MKKWKLIVSLFFILCMFVTISFVSAQDNATIDSDNSEYETQLGDNKSFNDLNNEINGDLNKTEIILNDNYLYQKEDNFTEGIIINRSLSIDGQGHVINANKLSRIFLINAKNVELKNIKFMNGNADLQTGGAIHFDYNADGRIINSMFLYNKAMNGGAIGEYENSMVTIINSTFIKNEAIYGGTIFCHNSSNAILDSVFINNSADRGATGFGGVIYYGWYSNSSILNSTFINNYATKDGGCILFSFDCNGTIINSTFINNKAKNGGAIYYSWYYNSIIDSTFINNEAEKGGAIYYLTGYKNHIIDSNFTKNSAKNGGGIFYNDRRKGIIDNSIFEENTAEFGSGIYYLNETSKSIVNNSLFIRNYATNTGAIYGGNAFNCTIIKITPKLISNKINSFYNENTYLTVNLKGLDDLPMDNALINLKINGKLTNLITDSHGKVCLSTKNLLPGTYNVIISYNGDNNYNNALINSNIIIKKSSIKIMAKKKTFKVNTKNKKYTVTLKDNKNLKINKIILSLKLKGKYYKATSKKGKVTFKIKLNKKGKYKGKLLFKGNNLYKKISKTVQITIK